MTAWHGGKGDDQRKEAEPGSFAKNFDRIDWTKRAREQQTRDALTSGSGFLHVDTGAKIESNQVNAIDPRKDTP